MNKRKRKRKSATKSTKDPAAEWIAHHAEPAPASLIPSEDERRVLNAAWDAAARLSPEERAGMEAWCADEYAPAKLAARRQADAELGRHPWREAPWPLQAFLTEGDFRFGGSRDAPENRLGACLGAAVADVLRDGLPLGEAPDRRNWAWFLVWLARTLTDTEYEYAGLPWMSDDPSRITRGEIWGYVAGEMWEKGVRSSWFELVAAAVEELAAWSGQTPAPPAEAEPASETPSTGETPQRADLPLTDGARAVAHVLLGAPPAEGRTAAQIVTAAKDLPAPLCQTLDESNVRGRFYNELKPWGMAHRPGAGYYVPASLRSDLRRHLGLDP